MDRTLASAAAVLVAFSLFFSFGTLDPWALSLVTAGALCALASVVASLQAGRRSERPAVALLAVGVALGLVTLIVSVPDDRRLPPQHPYVVSLAAVALAVVVSYALPRPPRWLLRARFPLLVCAGAGIITAALLHDRLPSVDVWVFRQMGAAGLAHGHDPYQLQFPNIYRHTRFYGPGVLEAGRVVVYPYPPLTVAVDLPFGLAFGDVRWATVALVLVAAVLVARLGRGPLPELAAALVLFQPRTIYLAEVGWTEPLVLVGFALALHAARRWRARAPEGWVVAGLAVGVLLSTKQYAPLLAAPIAVAAPRRGWGRAAAVAAAVVVAGFLPFALWDAHELWRDVAVAQLHQPFRPDALSWLAAWARWRGDTPTAAIGFVLGAAVLGLTLLRQPSLRRAAAIAGAALLVFLLFNKQAFCNYYWLAVGVLATAAALDAGVEAGEIEARA